ncbi:helix-turn-helix domain-containing protein [Amycolatopsis sp. H20-H5]|uniref:helix-turn-helix domain-containing protein n=1 Tax=Amycolatopsis sp. H20-H5 TaxID=3046309 RepID=UPI003FA3751B
MRHRGHGRVNQKHTLPTDHRILLGTNDQIWCADTTGSTISKRTAIRKPKRPRFYRVSEVTTMLNLSTVTLYRAIEAGEFPAIRVRGRIIIPARAVDDIEQAAVTGNRVVEMADFTLLRMRSGSRAVPWAPGRKTGIPFRPWSR